MNLHSVLPLCINIHGILNGSVISDPVISDPVTSDPVMSDWVVLSRFQHLLSLILDEAT